MNNEVVLIIHPNQRYAFDRSSDFIPIERYGHALYANEIGKYYLSCVGEIRILVSYLKELTHE